MSEPLSGYQVYHTPWAGFTLYHCVAIKPVEQFEMDGKVWNEALCECTPLAGNGHKTKSTIVFELDVFDTVEAAIFDELDVYVRDILDCVTLDLETIHERTQVQAILNLADQYYRSQR